MIATKETIFVCVFCARAPTKYFLGQFSTLPISNDTDGLAKMIMLTAEGRQEKLVENITGATSSAACKQ